MNASVCAIAQWVEKCVNSIMSNRMNAINLNPLPTEFHAIDQCIECGWCESRHRHILFSIEKLGHKQQALPNAQWRHGSSKNKSWNEIESAFYECLCASTQRACVSVSKGLKGECFYAKRKRKRTHISL